MNQQQQWNTQQAQAGTTAGYGYGTQQQMYPQQTFQPQQQAQTLPYFSAQQYQVPGFAQQQFTQDTGMLPLEMSFIENILRLNRGKMATVYMTFENNDQWNAKIFKGRVEAAGRDHLIISDPETGMRYLLLMVNLDYVTFDEPIEYEYPFGTQAPLAQYSPR